MIPLNETNESLMLTLLARTSGLVFFLRYRKSKKNKQEPSENKAEASYGLLMADRFNDQPDDEDGGMSKELEKDAAHEVESVGSHSRDGSR